MKQKSQKTAIIISMLLFIVTAISLTSGKYVYNSVWNYYLKSKGFYFESDLLDINTKNNSNLRWDGSNIAFVIKNSLNNELISDYDINYKVTCEVLGDEANYISCNLNNSNTALFNGNLSSGTSCINNIDEEDVSLFNKMECELNGYTWQEEITSKENYFNLELKDPTKSIDEVSVKITAESLTPYHQTLSGIFHLNKVEISDNPFIIDYIDYLENGEISITNTTTGDACFEVSFDNSNFLFDADNNILDSYADSNNKINKISIKVKKQSNLSSKFYKINSSQKYSVNDFVIEEKEC